MGIIFDGIHFVFSGKGVFWLSCLPVSLPGIFFCFCPWFFGGVVLFATDPCL